MITWDRFHSAIIGIGGRCGMPDVYIYSYDKMLTVLMEEDSMSERDAIDYLEFNVLGAYVGEDTPIIVRGLEEDERFELEGQSEPYRTDKENVN